MTISESHSTGKDVCQAQGWSDGNEYVCSLSEGHDGKHCDTFEGWEWEPYRPRVAFTAGSIAKVITARRRYVCGNHLVPPDERHYIEVGQRYVRNSLPPNNPEIGNSHWWFLRTCLDCCPVKHDERVLAPATSDL